ncbi:hypothetical protein RHGRI_016916 [Rhododendron griersonianum]|uniref:Uncharacterized protein n=1 Tax=Rhododendron griersonianum TaxID=479676 RepID=A0AAV6JWB9_9ERIC|nr:hypothetical protein RHGRI_016916 [Rhododendron griersonianum]
MRDAEERKRNEEDLSDENFKLKHSDLVLSHTRSNRRIQLRGMGEQFRRQRRRLGEGGAKRSGLVEAEESEEKVKPMEVVFEFGV